MTVVEIAAFGDSTTQGTGPVGTASSYAQAGKGCWLELAVDRLGQLSAVGPVLSMGLRGLWRGIVAGADDGEWATSGTWTKITSASAADRGPCGYAYVATGGTGKYKIGAGAYVNFPTVTADNLYHRFYVASAVTSTVTVAPADESATAVWTKPIGSRPITGFSIDYIATAASVTLVGIIPYYTNPPWTQGIIAHNLGVNGEKLNNLVATTSGDRLAFIDNVVLDTGATPQHRPTLTHIGPWVNDFNNNDAAQFATDMEVLLNRAEGASSAVLFTSVWEVDTTVYTTNQETYATTLLSFMGAQGYNSTDDLIIYTYGSNPLGVWTKLGAGTYTAAVAAGLLNADGVHQAQAGHIDQAERYYWHYREHILGDLTRYPRAYTVKGTASAVAYKGTTAVVAYAAGLPLSA